MIDTFLFICLERIQSNFEQVELNNDEFEKISAIGKNRHRYYPN
jgi:hypothetical protein